MGRPPCCRVIQWRSLFQGILLLTLTLRLLREAYKLKNYNRSLWVPACLDCLATPTHTRSLFWESLVVWYVALSVDQEGSSKRIWAETEDNRKVFVTDMGIKKNAGSRRICHKELLKLEQYLGNSVHTTQLSQWGTGTGTCTVED